MKYRVHYNNKYNRDEVTNNKQTAIRWANEVTIPATVEVVSTGDIIHENAAQRRINKNMTTLKRITDQLRGGEQIEKLIELPY